MTIAAPAVKAIGHPLEGFAVGSLPPQFGLDILFQLFGQKDVILHGDLNIRPVQLFFF